MHVLAGSECCEADLGVRGRGGEIDHKLHFGIAQQAFGIAGSWHVELGGPLLRALEHLIGTCHHVDVPRCGQVLQVGGADVSAADDADPHRSNATHRKKANVPG